MLKTLDIMIFYVIIFMMESREKKINDLDLSKWKSYKDILTDSLWIFSRRESEGMHFNWYWGNFIPQIPYQVMMRYTKMRDWVLDPFLGSGTTLIECRRLGRNGIGIELYENVGEMAKEFIESEENKYGVITDVYIGDSREINIREILDVYKIDRVQLIILHPPYYDIIRFCPFTASFNVKPLGMVEEVDNRDLSSAKSIEEFLRMFGEVVDNVSPYLEDGRYLVLVIGDKYEKGEWIPLGFYCMEEVRKRGYILKSIVVKNFGETRGKKGVNNLWRYRALANDFYVFKHEYVMIFKKEVA